MVGPVLGCMVDYQLEESDSEPDVVRDRYDPAKYLSNFELVLDTVAAGRYRELFHSEELSLFDKFRALSQPSKR